MRKMKKRTNENEDRQTNGHEPSGSPDESKQQHPDLSGLYFISFQPMGRAAYRGRVESAVNGLLLIELYDWSDNQPIEKRLVPIALAEWNDEFETGWKFYPDKQALEEASQELTEESEES